MAGYYYRIDAKSIATSDDTSQVPGTHRPIDDNYSIEVVGLFIEIEQWTLGDDDELGSLFTITQRSEKIVVHSIEKDIRPGRNQIVRPSG